MRHHDCAHSWIILAKSIKYFIDAKCLQGPLVAWYRCYIRQIFPVSKTAAERGKGNGPLKTR